MVAETKVNMYMVPGSKYATNGNTLSIEMNPYSSNMETQYVNNFHIQNKMLQSFKDMQSTSDSKVKTLEIDNYHLNAFNLILVYIYLGLLVLFILFCFIGKKMADWSFWAKIGIISIFLLYPFCITFIEQVLMRTFSYLFSFFNGSVYIRPSY
jgi:hypothetical protein